MSVCLFVCEFVFKDLTHRLTKIALLNIEASPGIAYDNVKKNISPSLHLSYKISGQHPPLSTLETSSGVTTNIEIY